MSNTGLLVQGELVPANCRALEVLMADAISVILMEVLKEDAVHRVSKSRMQAARMHKQAGHGAEGLVI